MDHDEPLTGHIAVDEASVNGNLRKPHMAPGLNLKVIAWAEPTAIVYKAILALEWAPCLSMFSSLDA